MNAELLGFILDVIGNYLNKFGPKNRTLPLIT